MNKAEIKINDEMILAENGEGFTIWGFSPIPFIVTDAPFKRLGSDKVYRDQFVNFLSVHKTPGNQSDLENVIERVNGIEEVTE